jgi:hypothetical protein
MMEPERPKADRVVPALLKSEALHPADFTIRGREAQSRVGEEGGLDALGLQSGLVLFSFSCFYSAR